MFPHYSLYNFDRVFKVFIKISVTNCYPKFQMQFYSENVEANVCKQLWK